MRTLGERLRDAAQALASVSDTPRLDAEILLSHALGLSRAKLLAELREPYGDCGFEPLLERRLNFEPIAYILGEWEFFSLKLACRAPMLLDDGAGLYRCTVSGEWRPLSLRELVDSEQANVLTSCAARPRPRAREGGVCSGCMDAQLGLPGGARARRGSGMRVLPRPSRQRMPRAARWARAGARWRGPRRTAKTNRRVRTARAMWALCPDNGREWCASLSAWHVHLQWPRAQGPPRGAQSNAK